MIAQSSLRNILGQAELDDLLSQQAKLNQQLQADNSQGLQLRYLETLRDLSVQKGSTIIFPFPIDMLGSFMEGIKKSIEKDRDNVSICRGGCWLFRAQGMNPCFYPEAEQIYREIADALYSQTNEGKPQVLS